MMRRDDLRVWGDTMLLRASILVSVSVVLLFTSSPAGSLAHSSTKPLPASTQPSQGVAAPALQAPPWTGDFDGILKRRYIRALVAYSKTQYYVVKGVQYGSSYEFLKAFEDAVNRKYPQKQKNLRFHVFFVPVPRDKMFSRLVEGKGDIAVGALTITPDRLKPSLIFPIPLLPA